MKPESNRAARSASGSFAALAAAEASTTFHAKTAISFPCGTRPSIRRFFPSPPAEALLDDPHLHDRGFWKEVEHAELGRSFVYPGEAAIYNGSPWRIARRAPLIGEHNVQIFCDELGLSRSELAVLAENRVI